MAALLRFEPRPPPSGELAAETPSAPDRRGRAAAWLRRAAREPLLHFVVLGALLYLVMDARAADPPDRRIVLDHARMDKLVADYRAEYGQDPTPVEVRAMADRYVSDEVYFREGMALGVTRDDEIVRRRVIQKAQFISQDQSLPGTIPEAELRAYFDAHRAAYARPARITFSHVFFGLQDGAAAALGRAQAALSALQAGGRTRAPERGDPFTDLYDFGAIDASGLKRLFGDTPIVAALEAAPVGRWVGPFRSAYGWHVVYVSARTPASTPPFAAVEDRVRADATEARQAQANARAYGRLRARYHVVGDRAGLATP